jgi:hypothetical protein
MGIDGPLGGFCAGFSVGGGLGLALKLNGEVDPPVLAGVDWSLVFGPKENPPPVEGNSNIDLDFGASGAGAAIGVLDSTCGGVTSTAGTGVAA